MFLTVALAAACAPRVKEESFKLANGLEVQIVATPRGNKAAVLMLFQVGLDHDPAGSSGMANLMSRVLLTGAAGTRPVRTREQLRQEWGDGWSVRTGADYTSLAFAIAPGKVGEQLDDFAARMTDLTIGESDLDRERPALLQEVAKMHGAEPLQGALNWAAEGLRPTRGHGWRGGIAQEIEAIRAGELEAFWRAYFQPRNARLVIAGPVDPRQVRARVEAAFGKLASGAVPILRPAADTRVMGSLVMGDAPSGLALAVAAPAPKDPLYPAFLTLATRLRKNLRGWNTSYSPVETPELLFVSGLFDARERPDDAAARLRKEVAAVVAAPLGAGEATDAGAAFAAALGAVPLKADDVASDPVGVAFARARRAQLALDGKPIADALKNVTAEKILEAAKLFGPQQSTAVACGGQIQ